jgi:uncharacterized protein DUF4242
MTQAEVTGYVAECFWPGVTKERLAEIAARARASAEALAQKGEHIRYLGSLLFLDDEIAFFQFEADSAETVRMAAEEAEVPFERIVESIAGVVSHPKRGP